MPSLGFHVLPSPDCLVLPQPCSSTRLDSFHVIALAPLAERQRSDKKTSRLPSIVLMSDSVLSDNAATLRQENSLNQRSMYERWSDLVSRRVWHVSGGYKPRKTRCRSSSSSLGGGTVETSLF